MLRSALIARPVQHWQIQWHPCGRNKLLLRLSRLGESCYFRRANGLPRLRPEQAAVALVTTRRVVPLCVVPLSAKFLGQAAGQLGVHQVLEGQILTQFLRLDHRERDFL